MCIHALELVQPQLHPLDFHCVCEIYLLKPLVGSENTLQKSVKWVKRITKVHNAMQHTLSDLLCYCSWRMVTLTRKPNKEKCSREVTAISFVMVQFTCFHHFWISNCMSCLKMSLLQFGFLCQLGPYPPPKKKVKPNEKNGKEIRMLYNKKQILVLRGQFLECMAESVWLGNL